MPLRHDFHDPISKQRQRQLAALEALFAPRAPAALPPPAPSTRALAKIVAHRAADPARDRLVAGLLAADGAEAVRRAVLALEGAGHAVPREQDALLRVLQHPDERRVRAAIDDLAALFVNGVPRRRTVLEDLADDPETREAATALRRRVHRAEA